MGRECGVVHRSCSETRSPQFVLVDCEHGNIGDDSMHESVAGVAASGASPIVRIRNADIGLIKRALDTGAQ
jgi:4-hydroxy-2-oxoheptanedioate aldolase